MILAGLPRPLSCGRDSLVTLSRIDGGKHYGHLEVDVTVNDSGQWQAEIKPVYVFPVTNPAGEVTGFERRVYNDVTTVPGREPATGN